MAERSERVFRHRRGALTLGKRTRLMGIVNVTPDSFSDGGRFLSSDNAVEHALNLIKSGAEIIDIGAESTRPGSRPVSESEQLHRLLPVLENLRSNTDAVISVDTRSAEVAAACIERGADVINDVSGLRDEPELAEVCAKTGAGLVLMHMRGNPETMQEKPEYTGVAAEVGEKLRESTGLALSKGVSADHILVDPGLGFGKSFAHNYELLRSLRSFTGIGAGILVGPSRKAFTAEFSGLPAGERQFSTAAAVSISIMNGADVIRVHDVCEMRQVTDICDRYRELANEQA